MCNRERTAPRFNAYHTLLSTQLDASESLDSLIIKVDEQITVIKSLSPSSFTLDNLYDELAVMAIIRAPHTPLMTLSRPFQSWTSLTSNLSSNRSETWIRLAPTSLAPLLPSLLHQHLPNRILRRPTNPSPLHPLLPPLSLPPVLQAHMCEFCTTTGHVEAKCFLKQHLLHHISPPSSPTASPASTSSIIFRHPTVRLSCISKCPFFLLIPA